MGSTGATGPRRQLAPANTPAAIQQGLVAQGMDQGGNFTPGRPLQPYFGYSTPARAQDYPVGVNIATQGRAAWNRVSFDVIKAIIDAYDVARICIDHKIDELRSMPLMFQPADGVKDDVDDAIEAAKLVLSYPDRELPYEAWLGKWLENYLKYDNAPLYKRRDGNGDIIALEVVDGKTVHPYIDEHGRRPMPPAPMAWQVIHGMVGTWFTRDDLIYVPFRPQEDSPYGLAPIESALLTANTDIRAQWHFLQMFTDGNVPAGFMELPPDVSQPEQVREWQDYWDATVMGDQAKLHQLLAVPNGSKFTGTKPAAFDKEFPNHLMRRMCAKFGVVAQDANLTDDVNRSTGETQTDIQFRVNTLPWVLFVQGILSRYLQHDIGLPVQVALDTGRDKEDRLQEAQAHQIYVEMGAESPDEVRVDVLGKPVDKERPTPRFFSTARLGPVTLLAIEGAAGKTDPETYGPAKDQLVLDQPYVPPIPVVPTPGTTDDKASLAAVDAAQVATRRALEGQQDPKRETEAQREARGAKQAQPGTGDAPLRPVPQGSQAQQQAAAQGTSAQEPDDEDERVTKASDLTGPEASELSAFREYVTQCKRRGRWTRDFVFKAVSPIVAVELNRGGRTEVNAVLKAKEPLKPTGPIAAGLALQAADTGRVLMLQRGFEDGDAASGTWEFPGGHIDPGEAPPGAAIREWEEEVGIPFAHLVDAGQTGTWTSSNGVYQGFVWSVPREDAIGIDDPRDRVINPDDPGRDRVEAIAWWDPAQLPGNPAVRRELSADIARVRRALGNGVAKAAGDPKASARSADTWPGWQFDLAAAAYWAPRLTAATLGTVDTAAIARAWLAGQHDDSNQADDKARRNALIATAIAWLANYKRTIAAALRPVLAEVATDGYAIGTAAAVSLTSGQPMDVGDWEPGEVESAERIILREGDGAGLRALFEAAQHSIGLIADTRTEAMAKALADAVLNRDPANALGDSLRSVLANPDRAAMLALDQITRASSAGAQAVYSHSSVATHQWLIEDDDACAICQANADQGPVPLGMAFESGNLGAPAHPRCRCATIPG